MSKKAEELNLELQALKQKLSSGLLDLNIVDEEELVIEISSREATLRQLEDARKGDTTRAKNRRESLTKMIALRSLFQRIHVIQSTSISLSECPLDSSTATITQKLSAAIYTPSEASTTLIGMEGHASVSEKANIKMAIIETGDTELSLGLGEQDRALYDDYLKHTSEECEKTLDFVGKGLVSMTGMGGNASANSVNIGMSLLSAGDFKMMGSATREPLAAEFIPSENDFKKEIGSRGAATLAAVPPMVGMLGSTTVMGNLYMGMPPYQTTLAQPTERVPPIASEIDISSQPTKTLPQTLTMKDSLLIGSSDFEEMRQHRFVDKSLFIKEILDDSSAVKLILRPRRFGKTSNLSMLDCFFKKDGTNRRYLFEGLEIWKHASCRQHQGKYPVIFLTFKDVKGSSFSKSFEDMQDLLADTYRKYYDEITLSTKLNAADKRLFGEVLEKKADKARLKSSLKTLTEFLAKIHGEKVILLVDEYDTPTQSSHDNGYYEEMSEFMRGLLGRVLKDNSALRQAVLTGILRVAKESIFSGLNNLVVYTPFSEKYSSCFGFSREEVKMLLAEKATDALIDQIWHWYGGYQFHTANLSNPWSVSNFIQNNIYGCIRLMEFHRYWINTAEHFLVKDLFKAYQREIQGNCQILVNRKPIVVEINEHVVFADLKKDVRVLWSLLLLGGYLTFKLNAEPKLKTLMIPNEELLDFYSQFVAEIQPHAVLVEPSVTQIPSMEVRGTTGGSEGLYFVEPVRPKGSVQQPLESVIPKSQASVPSVWQVPLELEMYTGRSDLLGEIIQRFGNVSNTIAQKSTVLACSGVAGVGKTLLAASYFYQSKSMYRLRWWFDAQSAHALENQYAELARHFQLVTPTEKPSVAVRVLVSWLEAHPGWLLVYDNAENHQSIGSYLPQKGGHILVTSRNSDWRDVDVFEIHPMTKVEELSLVRRIIGKDDADIEHLVTMLETSPLALAQAGGFVRQTGVSVANYLDRYHIERKTQSLVSERLLTENVSTTWEINLKMLQSNCPLAVSLLDIGAYLNGKMISMVVMSACLTGIGENTANLQEALNVLDTLSMLKVDTASNRIFSLLMLQEFQRRKHSLERRTLLLTAIAKALAPLYEQSAKTNSALILPELLNHIDVILTHLSNLQAGSDMTTSTDITVPLAKIAGTARYTSTLQPAKEIALRERARSILERHLGPEHLDVSITLVNLGNAYGAVGQLNQKIAFQERALTIQKTFFTEEGSETAEILTSLGSAYALLGNFVHALNYEERALGIYRRVLGDRHLSIATRYSNIGNFYCALGNPQKAFEPLEKALTISQALLGEQHPIVAADYDNLSQVHTLLGNHVKALEYQKRALAMNIAIFTDQHFVTVASYNNIGCTYATMSNYREALSHFETALTLSKSVLGEHHPMTADSYNHIGNAYGALGNHSKAVECKEQALAIKKAIFGEQHLITAMSYNEVGSLYGAVGNHAKSLACFENALTTWRTLLGEQHLTTAQGYHNVSISYSALGDHAKALECREQALTINKALLGEDNAIVAINYNDLGGTYVQMNNYPKALEYKERALAISERVLGKQHPLSATICSHISVTYLAKGDPSRALDYELQALSINKIVFGDQHPTILANYNNLARLYNLLGKHKQCAKCQEKILVINKAMGGGQARSAVVSYSISNPQTIATQTNATPMQEAVTQSSGASSQPVSSNSKKSKVGRNERCPCESGKKYKRCCGNVVQPTEKSQVQPTSTPKLDAQPISSATALSSEQKRGSDTIPIGANPHTFLPPQMKSSKENPDDEAKELQEAIDLSLRGHNKSSGG